MKFIYKILSLAKRIYKKFFYKKKLTETDSKGDESNILIKNAIKSNKPLMICRFGSVELDCVLNYLAQNNNDTLSKKIIDYVTNKNGAFWWEESTKFSMRNNAGFFPVNDSFLNKYSEHVLDNIKEIDILGSWLEGEEKIKNLFSKDTRTVQLKDLEPYYHKNPWSQILENKKVLVIHPFEETIKKQYQKNNLLFQNKKILPDFELITYKPIQSIAFEDTRFNNWFEALEFMCKEIDDIDFDIAIIGAGAYGFSLAAYIKKSGKQAIHLGGATQILFGIKGRRWEERDFFKNLFNEYWVRPNEKEKPKNAQNVENSCYW